MDVQPRTPAPEPVVSPTPRWRVWMRWLAPLMVLSVMPVVALLVSHRAPGRYTASDISRGTRLPGVVDATATVDGLPVLFVQHGREVFIAAAAPVRPIRGAATGVFVFKSGDGVGICAVGAPWPRIEPPWQTVGNLGDGRAAIHVTSLTTVPALEDCPKVLRLHYTG